VFYLPVAVAVYDVYGSFLDTESQVALAFYIASYFEKVLIVLVNPEFGSQYKVPVTVASVLIIIHLLSVLPIVANPVMARVSCDLN
jgi:hypothetical protein